MSITNSGTTHKEWSGAKWSDLNSLKMVEVMTPVPILIEEDTEVSKARQIFREKKIRHLPVVSRAKKGKLVGILSERDTELITLIPGISQIAVADLMRRTPFTVPETMSVAEAVSKMASKKYGCLLVTGPTHQLTGIFTVQDALRLLLHERAKNVPMGQTYPLIEDDELS